MRSKVLLLLTLTVTGCTTQQVKNSAAEEPKKITIYQNYEVGIASIILNKALTSFKNEYSKASKNKAFSQSVSGAWNWKSDRTSAEHAITSALIACQKNNKKLEDVYPCKVIHINDSWVE